MSPTSSRSSKSLIGPRRCMLRGRLVWDREIKRKDEPCPNPHAFQSDQIPAGADQGFIIERKSSAPVQQPETVVHGEKSHEYDEEGKGVLSCKSRSPQSCVKPPGARSSG